MTRSDICETAKLAPRGAQMMNPLTLAYVGDTVFDLAVRVSLIDAHDLKPGALNAMASKRVCAASQAALARAVLPELTEKEREVFARGRNAKPGTVPKNADAADYALATALESLIGFLYLDGQQARLNRLFEIIFSELSQVRDDPAPKAFTK